ncbi:MAG: phosphoribosylanthranilate isomerase [Maribacter sp.]|nr:phosphoribosylanthranilate isomerase [Maribacter sp.]
MKLKVCGMKYNTLEVAAERPDYLGFIFWRSSPRYFDGPMPELDAKINKVGVFVDAPIPEVIEKTRRFHLQAIQLHGNESPAYCKQVSNELDHAQIPARIIKVFPIRGKFNFDALKDYEKVCDYYLFDSKGKLPGGNGYAFDWRILKDYPSTKPYFLSGGIGLDAIASIESFFKRSESKYCYAIDLNSKFEEKPGLKDTKKLKEFKDALWKKNQ